MAKTKPKWEGSPFATLDDATKFAESLGMYAAPVVDIKLPDDFKGFQVTQAGVTTVIAQRKSGGPVRQLELPRPKRKRKKKQIGERLAPIEERMIGYYRYVVSPWQQVAGIRTMEKAREVHGFDGDLYPEPTFEGKFMSFTGASMAYFEYLETPDGRVYTRTVSKPVEEWPSHKRREAIRKQREEYMQMKPAFAKEQDREE